MTEQRWWWIAENDMDLKVVRKSEYDALAKDLDFVLAINPDKAELIMLRQVIEKIIEAWDRRAYQTESGAKDLRTAIESAREALK